jgi:hypothetical protein
VENHVTTDRPKKKRCFPALNLSKQVLYIYGICSKDHCTVIFIFFFFFFFLNWAFAMDCIWSSFRQWVISLWKGHLTTERTCFGLACVCGCVAKSFPLINWQLVKLESALQFNGTVETELFLAHTHSFFWKNYREPPPLFSDNTSSERFFPLSLWARPEFSQSYGNSLLLVVCVRFISKTNISTVYKNF